MRVSPNGPRTSSGSRSGILPWWRARLPLLLPLVALAGVVGVMAFQMRQVSAPFALGSPLSPGFPSLVATIPVPSATATPTSPELGDVLETLYIDVEPRYWQQIEAKRQEALERWILLTDDADLVPATLRLGSETYEARLRLKGDWADHVAHDKWSFRVELRGDGYIHGMRVFSIQDPSMRTYLNEYLYLEALRHEGILGVRYDFVRVVLNGEAKGIYAVEEGFAKELLEFQLRREGVIIRYAEDLLWEARAAYDDQTIPTALERFYIIDDFGSGSIDSSSLLSAERDTAAGLLRGYLIGDLTALEVFDLDALGTFLAAVDLWSAPHGLIWHNLRYYYNPVIERLEPVAFDNDPFSPELDFESVGLSSGDLNHDPYIQVAYARALVRMCEPGYV